MASERAGSKKAAKGTEYMTAAALHLHDDVLGEVLRRLAPRWLAASRCVCKAWRDVVDGHRLLRAYVLPLSLAGFFLNFSCHDYPEFFSRPTTTTTTGHLITGKLDFLPSEQDWQMALDHCNGQWRTQDFITRSIQEITTSRTGEFRVAVLNVFSSRTREWEERSFVREEEAIGTIADVASVRDTHYAAYWRGTLYNSIAKIISL